MWKDPTDVTQRKPRRLRGTPANRVVNILSVAFAGAFCLVAHWYTSSDIGWIVRRRERFIERVTPTVKEEIRREAFQNASFGLTLNTLNRKVDDELYGKVEDDEM